MEAKSSEPVTVGGREMRDRLRRTALEMFEQKGFRGTTMSEIAEACGVTKATLYYYFRTKTDLLEYVYETVNENLSNALANVSDVDIPIMDRFTSIIRAQVGHHVAYRSFLAVFWRERHELKREARARVRAREHRNEEAVRDLLREGQKEGMFREFDVESRMSLIFGVLSTVYRWAHHVDKSADEISDEILEFVFNGVARP
jgi:TetR/AcrR family transcriptional regulator, cholesterol catabolism regulator